MKKLKILLVDDEANILRSLSAFLEMSGYETETAGGADRALKLLAGGGFQVLLSDVRMPGMSGHELARRLRGRLDERARLVAVTGWGQLEDRRRTAEAGFDAHLVKPVDADALLQLMAEWDLRDA